MNIIKRTGETVPFDVDRIHRVVGWSVKDIKGVTASDIEINAKLQMKEGITTREIHNVLIDSAVNLISLTHPNYQYVAARLLSYQLRKDVWGGKNPPKLVDFINKNVHEYDVYDEDILLLYSDEEINKLDEYIDHDRDNLFTYAGMRQLCDKYLIQDRSETKIFETPQFAYMIIAMVCFGKYQGATRISYVKKAYDYFSKFKINLPTPLMAGVRSKVRQYASCCLIDVDDTLPSIFSSSTAAGYATGSRYGIGLNMGRIRPLNSPIRNGEVVHTGVIPFLKLMESTVKSCHQNGIRGGSATVNFPFWHYEAEDMIVLKNNSGTDDNRVRKLDYCIQFSELFYKRFLKNEDITLFSPYEAKELYDAFGHENFDELYEQYERKTSLKFKKTVKARKLMSLFIKERVETGRIYFMNIDHCNQRSSWDDDIKMTNLCVEVLHPTKPLQHPDDKDAEIGICILSAINVLEIQSDAEMEKVCDIIVRLLDQLIDYQDYFLPAAKNFTKNRRSLGIGITNFAAYLAKHDVKYTDEEAPNVADELMEKVQYYLLNSSCSLSKEKGKCPKFNKTKYSQGWLPIDTYKKEIDEFVTRKHTMDWEGLRERIKEYGLRHSTVSAIMPCESSSVIQCSTNGIEPIRSYITYKKSKARTLPVIVPNYSSYKNKYTLAYEMEDNEGLIKIVGALQKWIDMSISANMYYNYAHYENGALPDSKVIKEILLAYKLGWRTGYYNNTDDGDKQSFNDEEQNDNTDDGCESGACAL
jgi:ribonucleoside-diphosphate reductase alpha chain